VAASAVALWIALRLRQQVSCLRLLRLLAAVVMGGAIVGMHYIGMAAANFAEGSICGSLANGIRATGLDSLVLVTVLAVLTITLVVLILDAHLQARTAALSQSLTEANRELTHLARHDTLTGLPNRMLLADKIELAMRKVD